MHFQLIGKRKGEDWELYCTGYIFRRKDKSGTL